MLNLARSAMAAAALTAALTLLVPVAADRIAFLAGVDDSSASRQQASVIDAEVLDSHCSGLVPDASVAEAPASVWDDGNVRGTTSADLAGFAARFNEIRATHCLEPIPAANFVFDSCLQERLRWMAEDPSEDPGSAWGHDGAVRSDGLPSTGCDGNLAGGAGNTGATVAQKWWESPHHRASLYRPAETVSLDDVCIAFAMVHGGLPDEPLAFTRASARWTDC
ncbi:MAG: hypothetical protein JWR33_647 [Naasia sp.]|jgi:hypothetical protein|nr:hypothetical protein [Naasia sp.]